MNGICIVLYVNALYSQHLLNKPLTNRESNKLMLFPSQLFFSIVENLLRVYAVYYQYGYIIIHQFNKKRIVLQGFKLFPCDGVETTDSFYRLISALPIVIELVSSPLEAGVSFQHSCNTFLTWCFSTFTCECTSKRRMSLWQNENVSVPTLSIMSRISSHISISNRLRLLRIIFCKASVCSKEGANHIRLSFSVESCLYCR